MSSVVKMQVPCPRHQAASTETDPTKLTWVWHRMPQWGQHNNGIKKVKATDFACQIGYNGPDKTGVNDSSAVQLSEDAAEAAKYAFSPACTAMLYVRLYALTSLRPPLE